MAGHDAHAELLGVGMVQGQGWASNSMKLRRRQNMSTRGWVGKQVSSYMYVVCLGGRLSSGDSESRGHRCSSLRDSVSRRPLDAQGKGKWLLSRGRRKLS